MYSVLEDQPDANRWDVVVFTGTRRDCEYYIDSHYESDEMHTLSPHICYNETGEIVG